MPPNFPGPPLHLHREQFDSFYVLEGTLTLRLGEEMHELGPGSFALIPPGTLHTYSNQGGEPLRVLNFGAPAGFEGYFREAAQAMAAGIFDPALAAELASRYDYVPVS